MILHTILAILLGPWVIDYEDEDEDEDYEEEEIPNFYT